MMMCSISSRSIAIEYRVNLSVLNGVKEYGFQPSFSGVTNSVQIVCILACSVDGSRARG